MKKYLIFLWIFLFSVIIFCFSMTPCSKQKIQRPIEPYWHFLTGPWMELEGGQGHKYTFASILHFSADGEYSKIVCGLALENDKIYISGGDGWDIYLGRWKWKGNNLVIKSRLWYAMNAPIGYKYPKTDTEEIAVLEGDTLLIGIDRYYKGLIVDEENFNYYVNGAKMARKK